MDIINEKIDEKMKEASHIVDYEIDETNRVGTSVAKDMSGVGYGAIANALVENDNENNERENLFKKEVERRQEQERLAMFEKQKQSSFEQAVQEKEESLQVKADQRGLRTNVKQHDRDLTR